MTQASTPGPIAVPAEAEAPRPVFRFRDGWEGHIPAELRDRAQWVLWCYESRDGKWTKVPYQPRDPGKRARHNDPSTWGTFLRAVSVFRGSNGRFDGVGYVFSEDDPYCGVDADNSIGPDGEILAWAAPILDPLEGGYREISPSGKGIKAIVRATLPGKGTRRNGFGPDGKGAVEVYDRTRFFTTTGDTLDATVATIEDRSGAILELYRQLTVKRKGRGREAERTGPAPDLADDDELIRKARSARNGAKFTALFDRGDTSGYDGDDSSADCALCTLLGFWTGDDPGRIERLFGRSALGRRDKWTGRADYRAMTIARALEGRTEFYEPRARDAGTNGDGAAGSVSSVSTLGQDRPGFSAPGAGSVGSVSTPNQDQPDFSSPPSPIVAHLRPVPKFDPELLPDPLRTWALDIADRAQCALEFVAVGIVVALATVVGRRVGVRPKRHDFWVVVVNLWGMIVGRPGLLKTHALEEALAPLRRLAAAAREAHAGSLEEHRRRKLVAEARREAAKDGLKKAARKPHTEEELLALAGEAAATADTGPPPLRRYITNDCTVEKLGELLNENPNGILEFRDELAGFLKSFEKQGHEADRAFYLEGWNGTGGFTYDRISRGTVHIDSVCLSLLGSIQPGPLAGYVRSATSAAGDDGLVSRFQVSVFPDQDRPFRIVDRVPNLKAREMVFALFERLDTLDPLEVGSAAEGDGIPSLRFGDRAQEFFYRWLEELEGKLRANEGPALESHLSKYRSLMPSLALLFHLVDVLYEGTTEGGISLAAARRAADWCALLEQHARRIYSYADDGDVQPALTLAEKIKESLPNPFVARDVQRKRWKGLSSAEEVELALALLEERGWVASVEVPPGPRGGRPSTQYFINPTIHRGDTPRENPIPLPEGADKTDETPPGAAPNRDGPRAEC
jgi:putative DNA primase/helicase